MKSVAILIPHTDRAVIQGKFTLIGSWLGMAGYDPVFVTWDKDACEYLKQAEMPVLFIECKKYDLDVLGAAEQFMQECKQPICPPVNGVQAPTIGELFGLDDFLGSAAAYKFLGLNAFHPDVVVTPIRGAESNTPRDCLMLLQMSRFCRFNNVPCVGVELSPLDQTLRLEQWPCDILLTHKDPRTAYRTNLHDIAPLQFQMTASHQYVFSMHQDTMLQTFATQQEHQLRSKLGQPNERFIFFPFHIAFKQTFYAMLQRLNQHAEELIQQRFRLVIAFDSKSHRQHLTEREIVVEGGKRWLQPWEGHWVDVQDAGHAPLALLADAILACHRGPAFEMYAHWNRRVLYQGQEDEVLELSCGVSIPHAVAYLLEEQEKQEKEEAA